MTSTGRPTLRSLIAMQWDGGDAQGSILSPAFGICSVLHVYGHDVPEECEFEPGPMLNDPADLEDWPDSEIGAMYEAGEIDEYDLTYWARVLCRAHALLPEEQRY